MSINYIASASTPVDPPEGSNALNPTVVTPPVGMQAGDLVLMIAQARASSGTLSINTDGGQTWTSETQQNHTNRQIRLLVQIQWHMDCQSTRYLR